MNGRVGCLGVVDMLSVFKLMHWLNYETVMGYGFSRLPTR
jgi:hypothetical protein